MIRVLNIISDMNIGGAGRVILNYLRYSDKQQFETLVAIPRGSLLKEELEQAGVPVYEVDGMADRSYQKEDVAVLQDLIRQVKPDLVHTHGSLSGRIAARRCHVPVVYSRHSAFPVPAKLKYPPGRWINKLINEHYADHIIAVSPATRDNLTEAGISPKKITVVMNGVAPVPETTAEERRTLRESLSIPEDTLVFGILARLEDYKGHLYLVHAGLPTIASDYGGNPFLIRDGENGLIFPSKDSAALAKAMARLMDHPDQRTRMGQRAREIFQAEFTGSIFAKHIEDIYRSVLKGAN